MAATVLDDRYELLERVGSGGMASVYRGKDRRLGGREVAIKMLHPHLAERPESRLRFKHEAEAAARLEHRNILKVYDASQLDSEDSYIVMEFVHGRTLTKLVNDRPVQVPELGAMIAHQVALAVAHAHRARIIHRDIKPENVMVREDGAIKLMDFGIARAMDHNHMTTTGALMGSPAHMAPELIEGEQIDFRADVFSLGTLLYYVITGVLPFSSSTPHGVLLKIVQGVYEPAQRVRPRVGRELSAIVDRALARNRDDRYASVEHLADALASYLLGFGIEDPASELRDWHPSQDEYEAALQGRVVTTLFDKVDRSLKRNRRARALEHLDRILQLEPDNARAAELLTTLTAAADGNSRRWLGLGAVAALVAVALGAWWWASRPAETDVGGGPVKPIAVSANRLLSTAPALQDVTRARLDGWNAKPSPRPPTVPPPVGPPPPRRSGIEDEADTAHAAARFARRDVTTEYVRVPLRQPPDRPTTVDPTPTPPEIPPSGATPVRLAVHPPSSKVTIGGKPLSRPWTTRLAPGIHRVIIELPDCIECRRTEKKILVKASEDEQKFPLEIQVEDAKLQIDSNTPGAVWYKKRSIGQTGELLYIKRRFRDREGIKKELFRIEAPGHSDTNLRLSLKPGKTERRKVHLVKALPTP